MFFFCFGLDFRDSGYGEERREERGEKGRESGRELADESIGYIPPMPSFKYVVEQLNAGIPNLGAVLGPAIGLVSFLFSFFFPFNMCSRKL